MFRLHILVLISIQSSASSYYNAQTVLDKSALWTNTICHLGHDQAARCLLCDLRSPVSPWMPASEPDQSDSNSLELEHHDPPPGISQSCQTAHKRGQGSSLSPNQQASVWRKCSEVLPFSWHSSKIAVSFTEFRVVSFFFSFLPGLEYGQTCEEVDCSALTKWLRCNKAIRPQCGRNAQHQPQEMVVSQALSTCRWLFLKIDLFSLRGKNNNQKMFTLMIF